MSTLNFSELSEGKAKRIEVDGVPVCVARIGDEVFAIGDTCSHSDASLAEGDISGYKIECWLHGAEFDLRTGAAVTLPATTAVPTFSVQRDGDTVTISASKEA
jgi:3-phenylpropionate/trans-cinnamate dioxygenase ferredoxin subunit